jgi:hypothetical protein
VTSAAVLVALLLAARGESRLAWAEVELHGPLEEVRFDCGREGHARLRIALAAGEERSLRVPLPLGSFADAGPSIDSGSSPRARLQVRGAGRASVRSIAPGPAAERFERLPPGLRARPRPPVGAARARAGAAELLLVAAALLISRSRTRWVLAACAAGIGGLVFVLAARRVPVLESGHVVEIDTAVPEWIEIEGAFGVLDLPAERLEAEPSHAPLELDLELVAGEVRGRVRSPGARVYRIRVGSGGLPTRDRNEDGDFERSYTRDASGAWLEHGPWARGEPLPEGGPLRAQPPGWLVAGCAPGRTVFLGARADGAWVRALGF